MGDDSTHTDQDEKPAPNVQGAPDVIIDTNAEVVTAPAPTVTPKKTFSLYEYFQTDKGRRNSWYIGLLATTIATLSAAYAFWPKPTLDVPVCSAFETQDQRWDCMLEQGTISVSDYTQMAEAMRIEIAPSTKGIPLAQLDPTSTESRFETTVRQLATDRQQARREALVLARHPDTRASGLDKLAGLAKTAQDWRQVGELAYPWDTAQATNAYAQVVKIGSSNVLDYIYLSRLYQRGGALNAAKETALAIKDRIEAPRDRYLMLFELGVIAQRQGNLTNALAAFQDGLEIAERLTKADSSNTVFQRDLSMNYNKIGDVAKARGDLTAARSAFQDGLKIAERLAKADTSNTEFQRDLFVSFNKIGDVASAQGDLTAARAAY